MNSAHPGVTQVSPGVTRCIDDLPSGAFPVAQPQLPRTPFQCVQRDLLREDPGPELEFQGTAGVEARKVFLEQAACVTTMPFHQAA